MKASTNKLLSAAIFIVLVAITAILYISVRQSHKVRDTAASVSHAEEVMLHLEQLMVNVLDNETGARGYLITGKEQFLEPTKRSEHNISSEFDTLTKLTRDTAILKLVTDSLKLYIYKRIGFSKEMINTFHTKGKDAAATLVSTEEGKQYMDRAREIAGEIRQRQDQLLQVRRQKNASSINELDIILYSTLAIGLILSVLVLRRIISDFNKQKKLERDLIKINGELEAFTYSVSHDLRAPLRGIVGFVSILEEEYGDKLDSEAQRIMTVIRSNALKMGNLIDDLLAFSRMGKQEIIRTEIDTELLINEIKNDQSILYGNKTNISWIIQHLPRVKADINTIRQVWVNLISNALKYSGNKEQTIIEIGAEKKDDQIIFFVKDNGVGFDQKYKNKLFKVFQRLHSSDEFEGTGVGLALVEKIISRHGGNVWAEGEVGKGAKFFFSLPT